MQLASSLRSGTEDVQSRCWRAHGWSASRFRGGARRGKRGGVTRGGDVLSWLLQERVQHAVRLYAVLAAIACTLSGGLQRRL